MKIYLIGGSLNGKYINVDNGAPFYNQLVHKVALSSPADFTREFPLEERGELETYNLEKFIFAGSTYWIYVYQGDHRDNIMDIIFDSFFNREL